MVKFKTQKGLPNFPILVLRFYRVHFKNLASGAVRRPLSNFTTCPKRSYISVIRVPEYVLDNVGGHVPPDAVLSPRLSLRFRLLRRSIHHHQCSVRLETNFVPIPTSAGGRCWLGTTTPPSVKLCKQQAITVLLWKGFGRIAWLAFSLCVSLALSRHRYRLLSSQTRNGTELLSRKFASSSSRWKRSARKFGLRLLTPRTLKPSRFTINSRSINLSLSKLHSL